jgi:hypothetical protein
MKNLLIGMVKKVFIFCSYIFSSDKEYFEIEEFACKCGCKENKISPNIIKMLNVARNVAGIPFEITSGYRCEKHNKAVGGVAGSSHIGGSAVDILCGNDRDRYRIILGLLTAGFNRIGVGADFIHCDIDEYKSADVIWKY